MQHIDALLSSGVDTELRDGAGRTPLHVAAFASQDALIEAVVLGDGGPDHIATVAALVNGGADKDLADRRGVTPLTHARERGYQEIVELLKVSR